MDFTRIRQTCDIRGVIQGVGFRPTLYRLAVQAGLAGSVQNRAGTVRLVLEGERPAVEAFLKELPGRLPANARLDAVVVLETREIPANEALAAFTILDSAAGDETDVTIPADLAICSECLREVMDPQDRRHGYPFTTCTLCGPRYTVIASMPYDRARTSLARFPLCPDCEREYRDVGDRRFHCETIACPRCGPRLSLDGLRPAPTPDAALPAARRAIADGAVVAVRGIGGFLLAADAFNRATLETLRRRKHRPHKPFAVMAPDIATLRRYCVVPPEAETLLKSPEAPIVILDVRGDAASRLPLDLLTPDAATLGVMLPTSALHHLLLHPLPGDPVPPFNLLVMTSGNRRGEPICITNEEARARLRDVADVLLEHDREVLLRNDDSLCVLQRGAPQVWRRARGYAPQPIVLLRPVPRCVLAMGAELKNAIAVAYDARVVLSPHVGDLDTPEAIQGLEQVADLLPRFLGRVPQVVAVDLHPDMACTALGRRIAGQLGAPVVEVQHHHAHGAACLAEHGRDAGLALVLDGTGLGPDGAVWGAELLDVGPGSFRRLATFAGVPLPGGDAAIRHPARQLVARWADAGVAISDAWLRKLGVSAEEASAWQAQCVRGLNAPLAHGAGRLFDAFSVLLGFAPETMTYEGQPAIRLEAAARRARGTRCEIPFHAVERAGLLQIEWRAAFRMLHDAPPAAEDCVDWAMAAHRAIADAALAMICFGLESTARKTVALSGGVFMNRILNDLLVPRVQEMGIECLIHRSTPPNDGCIALGQAVVAAERG